MIRRLNVGSGNVLGYEISGRLTKSAFEALSEEFRSVVEEHGGVRLLVRMRQIPRLEAGAMAEDLKLVPYADKIERYAIVGDSALSGWPEKIADAVVAGEVKHFDTSRPGEAWRWLQS